jgi:plastocyanin
MRINKPVLRNVMALAASAIVAGCDDRPRPAALSASPATAKQPAATTAARVGIDNFTYTPATLTVTTGTTVTWVNHDDVPHTVTANDKAFASKALDTDDAYSHTFFAPGTYSYFCAVHPHMTGQIIVK